MKMFYSTSVNKGIRLDPRTKIIIMLMVSTFVFAGVGGNTTSMYWVRLILVIVPFFLLALNKNFKIVFIYGLSYIFFSGM